jgi:DNA topoisomerase I
MANKEPIFDVDKARQAIEKGRRGRWWRRRGRTPKTFYYVDDKDNKITDEDALERIRKLVIPPAWKHVRICPFPNGRLQAVGMDGTGRVQYLYHGKYAEKQQRKKFEKIERLGDHLPELRRITTEHLSLDGMPREKVLAVMMRLINSLYIRVGTEKSAKHYKTFGITTLKNKHLTIGRKGKLTFDYVGKSHVQHRKVVVDEEIASILKELKSLGRVGKLFNYVNGDGKVRPVKPGDINQYLKEATGPEFSTKDFRTWGGSLLAALEFAEIGCPDDEKETKQNIVNVVRRVAEQLGNTPAVCRSSYIHPKVISAYEKGITIEEFTPRKSRRIRAKLNEPEPEEAALIQLFKKAGC